MFMPSFHMVGWCPVLLKLSMQIFHIPFDNNNHTMEIQNTCCGACVGVWSDTDKNIILMWHRNWPVIIQWKCNQCICVCGCARYICLRPHLMRLFHAMPLKPINPFVFIHNTLTMYSTKENAHCNGHTDDQNTKEEEVYHDLCAIHRATRSQVLFFAVLRSLFLLNFALNLIVCDKYQMLSLCPIAVKMRLSQSIWKWMFYFWSDLIWQSTHTNGLSSSFLLEFGNCTFSGDIDVLRTKYVQIVIWNKFDWTSVVEHNRTYIY